MFFTSKKTQLKIYYFFMLADGKCSSDENDKFSSICEAMCVYSDDKNDVINFCESVIHISDNDNSTQVIREIDKLLTAEGIDVYNSGSLNNDKCRQVETIWNLINLAYTDVEYSEAEKKVVSFLANYWKIDSLILSDLNDTAETILMLTCQKDWVKTSSMPYYVINANIKEIDANIARMANDIDITVAETNIA